MIDGLLAACDGDDGLRDGIVADPIGCRFDPGGLRCAGAKADRCLSAPQVDALSRAFAGPKDSKGRQLDSFDMLSAVVDWVEGQKPPQAIRATGRSWPGRSRPLCPYPSHAHYKGTGDVEDAASFECR